jgi:uncharacterized membrane protein YphA (DoxX/SURF4 family)
MTPLLLTVLRLALATLLLLTGFMLLRLLKEHDV